MFDQIHAEVSRAQQADLHRHVAEAQRHGTLMPKLFEGAAWNRRRRARQSADEIAVTNARRAARDSDVAYFNQSFY